MPYTFTEEEKIALRAKYRQNVELINKYLPRGMKVKLDMKAFNKKINDPNEQRYYKKSLELIANNNKRFEIAKKLLPEYEELKKPDHVYLLDRTIAHSLIPSDSKEAEAYNRKVIKCYVEHPEAFLQKCIQQTLNFNPADLAKIGASSDFKNQQLAFYEKYLLEAEYGYTILDTTKGQIIPMLTEDYQKYSPSFMQTVQTLGKPTVMPEDDTYFTLPKLTDAQMSSLQLSGISDKNNLGAKLLVNSTFDFLEKSNQNEIKKLYTGAEKKNIKLESGSMIKMIAKDTKTGELVPYSNYMKNDLKTKNKVEIQLLDNNTVDNIKKFINRDFIKEENVVFPTPYKKDKFAEFMNHVRYKHAVEKNIPMAKADNQKISEFAGSIRRGFFEFLGRRTSDEGKNLKTAIDRFEDPDSKDFKNIKKLKEYAQTYLDHKNVRTKDDVGRLTDAGKNRSILCLEIVEAAKLAEDPNININNKNIIKEEIDFGDDLKEENNIIITNDLGKNNIIENELEK